MKIIYGDLIKLGKDGTFDVIIHGCNIFNTQGKGIALSMKRTFPTAYAADLATIKGDRTKLGNYTSADIQIGTHILTVVNAYTQAEYWGSGVKLDYDALTDVFNKIKKDFSGKRIAFPMIGAGLAKGNWDRISTIIDTALMNEDYTLIKYKQK